ncbi:MAG: hypothetical protein GY755_08625 [Chloroflexi bacterium]|nr:hypothetical protein [Chloroflexota bacterium]
MTIEFLSELGLIQIINMCLYSKSNNWINKFHIQLKNWVQYYLMDGQSINSQQKRMMLGKLLGKGLSECCMQHKYINITNIKRDELRRIVSRVIITSAQPLFQIMLDYDPNNNRQNFEWGLAFCKWLKYNVSKLITNLKFIIPDVCKLINIIILNMTEEYFKNNEDEYIMKERERIIQTITKFIQFCVDFSYHYSQQTTGKFDTLIL